MMKYYLIALGMLCLFSCRKVYEVHIPNTEWDQFNSPSALPLMDTVGKRLEGVYTITDGASAFGQQAALKWSYNAHGTDTTFYLTILCEKDVAYFILEGKRVDSTILLNGYWRRMANTETGKAHFMITPANGAAHLLNDSIIDPGKNITIQGQFGTGEEVPGQSITLTYNRTLYHSKPMEIVVHRGGGQTADLLPASENSAQIIEMASRFGATGIEIDVRLTKDGVPILYHDADLSERLIQKNGMVGPIENYTYAQLNSLVRLIRNGERIPTLREALQTVVYNTPLKFVWLDTKFHNNMQIIRDLQQEFTQKSVDLGKSVEILIGIPDEDVLKNFEALPDYKNIPSVCELDPPVVAELNSRIWGPRWTTGLQTEAVDIIHSQGKRAFVWTLDHPQNIQEFMNNGHFDGILTDYPSAVAYYYYVQQ